MKLQALVENKDKLELVELPFNENDLAPVMDKDTVRYHYNVLSRGYVDRYNSGEGDKDFNYAGGRLHNLWWEQLSAPSSKGPKDKILELIEKKYTSYAAFKEQFNDTATKIQGSGWCYLSTTGEIKTIKNHKWEKDILLLVDCWEHSADPYTVRKDYLKTIWRIINWDAINSRIDT